jgi:hypothetical protein
MHYACDNNNGAGDDHHDDVGEVAGERIILMMIMMMMTTTAMIVQMLLMTFPELDAEATFSILMHSHNIDFKSAPSAAYNGRLARESKLDSYPESVRVLRGLPCAPFHGGWLEKATLKLTQNQPQVLQKTVKSLVKGCRVPLPPGEGSRKQP